MPVSIIIPAYNEGQRLGKTLEQYLAFFKDLEIEFIIVVNNSNDNTIEIARDYSDRFPDKVRVHEIQGYSGKGGAVLEGFRISHGNIIGFVDADGSTSAEEYKKLLSSIGKYDVTILSRWKKGSKIVNPNIFREIVSLGFMCWVKLLFWMPVIDTQCGAKIFKRQMVFSIIDKMKIKDMAFDVELLWRLHKSHNSIMEIPSVWIDNSYDSAALSSPAKLLKNAWIMFSSIVKLRFEKIYDYHKKSY